MVLEGESRLTGAGAKGVVGELVGSAMGRQWQFPQSAGPSLIEVEFGIGEP